MQINASSIIILLLLIIFHGCSSSNIRDAIEQDNAESVRKFLKEGVDVNAKYENDFTLLHFAAMRVRKKIAKADYISPQKVRLTYSDNIEIIKLLVEAGANVNAEDKKNNFTPIHYCYILEREECIKYLIDHGSLYRPRPACEIECIELLKNRQLKEGITLEACIKDLCK